MTTELSILGDRVPLTRPIEETVDAANSGAVYSPPGPPPINNTTIEASPRNNIRVRLAGASRKALPAPGGRSLDFGSRGIAVLERIGLLTGARVRS